ncbi:MAG: hypothetical protein AWU57_187 [Marinobacter sp. T13-3]|nr:MAG: hypothetical protein AWU57_187 [Marinobacter sp. T13-3]
MKHLWFVVREEVRKDFVRPMDSTDWLIVLMLPLLLGIPLTIIWANS